MDTFLPPFFAIAASLALIAALSFLWRSLRAAFGAADSFHLPSAEAESRRILEERKTALLSNLADLEFEHAGDKISDEDYEALDKKLRVEAKRVLRLLDDDVKPYRAKAEKRLQGFLSERGAPYRQQAEKPADIQAEPQSESKDVALSDDDAKSLLDHAIEHGVIKNSCLKCETVNDPDAVFCKKCGNTLGDKAMDGEVSDASAEEDA